MATKDKAKKNKSKPAMKDLQVRKANKVQGGATPLPGPEDFQH